MAETGTKIHDFKIWIVLQKIQEMHQINGMQNIYSPVLCQDKKNISVLTGYSGTISKQIGAWKQEPQIFTIKCN